jgi:hypothetical protein
MVQDESVGFVQGTAFRSGNHCALRALVSQIQTELSGLGPNDGGTRSCADAHDDSALGAALCARIREALEPVLSASRQVMAL